MSFYFAFDKEEAIQKLQELGYRVIKVDFPEGVFADNINALIDYFYARRLFYNPDRLFPASRNFEEDRKYIGRFIKRRQKTGLNKANAVKEAAVLIETLFKHEKYLKEHLKLNEPFMSPHVLEVGFIMDRVCAIANGEIDEANEAETEAFVNEINKRYDKKFAERDSERAAQNMKEILEKLHGQRYRNTEGRTKRD